MKNPKPMLGSPRITVAVLIVMVLSGCTTMERLISDLQTVIVQPEKNNESSRVTSLGSLATIAVSEKGSFVVLNNPDHEQNVGSYRTNVPLQHAQALARTRTPGQIGNDDGLASLVKSLIEPFEDPFLRLKAIHDWVALSIRYDAQAFLANEIGDQSWQAVLRSGKAVCAGYANLMEKMLTIAGIENLLADGYARGVGSSALESEDPGTANHAWNLAKIDNFWYLLDTTWDSGYLDGRTAVGKYSTDYFLIKPDWFIHTHYPSNPQWQLLNPPVTATEFAKLPFLKGGFFDVVLDYAQAIEQAKTISEPTTLKLHIHDGVNLTAELYDSAGKKHPFIFSHQDGSSAYITLAPPPGKWLLRFFASKADQRVFHSIGEMAVQSTNESRLAIPVVYGDFSKYRTRLVEPALHTIVKNREVTFTLYAENIYKMFLVANGRTMEMSETDPGVFSLTLNTGNAAKIDIYVQASATSGRRNGLVTFPVLE